MHLKAFIVVMIMVLAVGCSSSNRRTSGFESAGQTLADGFVELRGEVRQPGAYPYVAGMTVADAVSAAGGLNDFASGVTVLRNGNSVIDHYNGGGSKRTAKSKYMRAPVKGGDVIRIKHMSSY